MGASLCTFRHKKPHQKPNSHGSTTDGNPSSDSTKFINLCFKVRIPRDSKGNHMTETSYQKKAITKASRELTLEDLILASPGFTPDYLIKKSGSELRPFKHRKKRIHPSSKVGSSAISEAKDSLCLERPNMNLHRGEGEEKSEFLSISRSLSDNSQKKVSFKLPHVVIFYSPDEVDCREEGGSVYESDEPHSTSEDSFDSPMITGSFDTPEELRCRLAVHTLPHVIVSLSCV